MKTLAAYGVDPAAVFSSLKAAGQPVVEIRYRGPQRASVAFACVCLEDSADLAAVAAVVSPLSAAKPAWGQVDDHVAALAEGVGKKLTSYKG